MDDLERLRRNRTRLEARLTGIPDDDTLRSHLEQMSAAALHTFVISEQWDSGNVGGEEVDVDWLLPAPETGALPTPREAGDEESAQDAGDRPRGWTVPVP